VVIKAAIVVLAVACPMVLVAGVGLTQYQVVSGPIVSQISGFPLPVPGQFTVFNRSVGVAAVAEANFTLIYRSMPYIITMTTTSGLSVWTPPPESQVDRGDLFYAYFGFMFLNGAANYSLYNAGDMVIERNHGETQGTALTSYVLEEANNEGTYRFILQNVGQSVLNATLYVGLTRATWSKPYFFVGLTLIVAGVVTSTTLGALLVIWTRRTKRT
jgi:hypothetical protein